jgi:hypothetical protein
VAATPQNLVDEIQTTVDVTEADALTELNRRHLQMWERANPLAGATPPADLTLGGSASTVKVDEDLRSALVDAAVATFLRRIGEDQATAQVLEERFSGACDEQYQRNLRLAAPASALVQRLVNQIRNTVAGVSEAEALEELNERHLRMYRRAHPYAPVLPADLTLAGGPSTVFVDTDLQARLVDGAIATFLQRRGEGDPAALEQRFDAAAEELHRRALENASPLTLAQQAISQVRTVLPGLSVVEVRAELNSRYVQMWRIAHPRDLVTVPTPIVDATNTIDVPSDLQSGLVDGALATFQARAGRDPGLLEQRFQQAAQEWRKRVRRASGSGPDLILLPA